MYSSSSKNQPPELGGSSFANDSDMGVERLTLDHVTDTEEFPSMGKECALNPLPNEAFAPVSWKIWDQVCFSDNALPNEDAKNMVRHSFAVHLNNRKTGSKLQNMEYRKGSLCDHVLNSFCKLCVEFLDYGPLPFSL